MKRLFLIEVAVILLVLWLISILMTIGLKSDIKNFQKRTEPFVSQLVNSPPKAIKTTFSDSPRLYLHKTWKENGMTFWLDIEMTEPWDPIAKIKGKVLEIRLTIPEDFSKEKVVALEKIIVDQRMQMLLEKTPNGSTKENVKFSEDGLKVLFVSTTGSPSVSWEFDKETVQKKLHLASFYFNIGEKFEKLLSYIPLGTLFFLPFVYVFQGSPPYLSIFNLISSLVPSAVLVLIIANMFNFQRLLVLNLLFIAILPITNILAFFLL